ARDSKAGHCLSAIVEHLEDGTLLLRLRLGQQAPRTDDACDLFLQRTFGQIPGEAHRAGHPAGATIAPRERQPFPRGCAVRVSARETRARLTHASIKRVQYSKPVPGD